LFEQRSRHPALHNASGGVWRGAIYDVDRIIEIINAGLNVEHKK
jgi:hypothetical protein